VLVDKVPTAPESGEEPKEEQSPVTPFTAYNEESIGQYMSCVDTVTRFTARSSPHPDILIIQFDGVLGGVYKKNMISPTFPNLYLRPDVIKGLQMLQQRFGLVLVINLD
jgi:hypothetical protein